MMLPYILPLVMGRPGAIAAAYSVMLAVFVPFIYLGATLHGAIAAAYGWVGVTALGLVLAVPLLGVTLSPADARRWLASDVALPWLQPASARGS
jgi:hypothetical protein